MGEKNDKLEFELASFRQQWHEELLGKGDATKLGQQSISSSNQTSAEAESNDIAVQKVKEEKAVRLFLQGVKLERDKKLYEAIKFYRQAVHLYPDVESRVAEQNTKAGSMSDDSETDEEDEEPETTISEGLSDLGEVFQKYLVLGTDGLCQPCVPTQVTHISALPTELLVNIFRWLVSNELDVRSLCQVSLVCKWFYACARDPEIWRRICIRLWGVNCGSPVLYNNCWKQMYQYRPHLNYNGVYISKYSYVRPGEQGLDEFYRPYHLVEYYRYLRFYVDGSVLLHTSSEEPHAVIPLLKRKNPVASGVSRGHYRLSENIITVIVRKIQTNSSDNRARRSRGTPPSTTEQTFCMELLLKHGEKHRRNRLEWNDYCYESYNRNTGLRYSNSFDLRNYTPFYFSRVKSFLNYSCHPL